MTLLAAWESVVGDMSGYVTTAAVYLTSAWCLWLATRRSKSGYIRWQWRRPHWILLRLLVLAGVFHGLFALVGVHPALGFLFVGLFAVLALTSFDAGAAAFVALGFAMHEWIFWLPSRRELVLREPRSVPPMSSGAQWVGQVGTVASDLKPAGTVIVQGVERPARSEQAFMERGEQVIVVAAADFEVIVRKVSDRPGGASMALQEMEPVEVQRPGGG